VRGHMLEQARPVVVTLYDVIPYVFPDWYQRDGITRAFFRRRAELLRNADAVVAISEHTRRDAIELIHFESPRRVAILPSRLAASFKVTQGSPSACALK